MLILAVDTCDTRGSLAVSRDATLLASSAHTSSQDYSSWLLPAADQTLAAANVRLSDIDLFAVAAGPGSFTALRVGMTTVKAWAEVYRRPIAPVSRLEAMAEQFHQGLTTELVAAFVDARREQLYAGLFQRTATGFSLLGEESVISSQEFLDNVAREAQGRAVSWLSLDPQALSQTPAWSGRASTGESVLQADPIVAPAIARMALRIAAQGRTVDALALDANYIRRCDAELFQKGGAFNAK